jgi:polar amino acid transport system substrate-binding protein
LSKKLIAFFVSGMLILSLGLAGCGGQQKNAALRVGTEPSFAPFEFQDDKSKDYAGFDMDLIRAIAKQMGTEVQIQSMGFDALVPALEAKSVDVVISGMTINEERAKKVKFSKPYYKSGLAIIVKNDNTTINSFNDLAGKNIAVQIGTSGAEEAKKIKDAKVREFNTPPEAFMELKAGGVDAVINDKPVNDYFIKQAGGQDTKQVGEPLTSEDYGIAVAGNNAELAAKIDKALDELKKSGEYDKIYEKWFGPAKK